MPRRDTLVTALILVCIAAIVVVVALAEGPSAFVWTGSIYAALWLADNIAITLGSVGAALIVVACVLIVIARSRRRRTGRHRATTRAS